MSPPTTPDLRPLAIGELIDRAAAMWRKHFGALFRLYLGFALCIFILQKLYELAMMRWFPLVAGGAPLIQALDQRATEVLRQYLIAAGPMLCLGLAIAWLGWAVGIIGSHYTIRTQLGQPTRLSDGFARVRARLGVVNGAFLLAFGWGLLVVVASALPGAGFVVFGAFAFRDSPNALIAVVVVGILLLSLGVILAMLWYVLRFLFTPQVIAMEDVGPWTALKRSGQLVSGRVGPGVLNLVKVRATLVLTIVFAILMIVGLIAGAPEFVLRIVYANPLDPTKADPAAIPQLLLVPAQLLSVVAQSVFSPLYLVVGALFYVDMRVRREGLDLELRLAKEEAGR